MEAIYAPECVACGEPFGRIHVKVTLRGTIAPDKVAMSDLGIEDIQADRSPGTCARCGKDIRIGPHLPWVRLERDDPRIVRK